MTWLRKMLLSAILLLIPWCAFTKVYMVSVGVADYPGESSDLSLPAADARVVTWLYTESTDIMYCMLLDDEATKARIKAAMKQVFAMADAEDIVVFFFSGYGFPGGFCAYDGNLSYKDIRNAMSKSRSTRKMIFADACFSGKIRTEGPNARLEISAAKNADVMLFLSSRSDEISYEGKDMVNGYFTTYLQKGLRGGADVDRNRVITARELFEYVHQNVVYISGGNQHPVMWGRFPDDMPVMNWK